MMRLLVFLLAILLGPGCAYPTNQVRTIDERPSIVVKNAPKGSILFVDGLNMGEAEYYNGKKRALALETGTHKVEVINAGTVIFAERVYLGGGGVKTLTLQRAVEEE